MSKNVNLAAVLTHYIEKESARPLPLAQRLGWQPLWCPFHQDRVPSASVNFDKGLFHCFVCRVSGDGVTVVRWKEGLDYVSALEFLEGIPDACDGPLRSEPGHSRVLFDDARVLKGQRTVFQTGSSS